ncbi:MAG: cation:proton antiporter [Alphaproteobacteria bacterium]
MEGGLHLTGIAIVAVAATLCGMLMTRLRQPPIVGYIMAGMLLGPSGLGLVEDREQVALLAELGVLMLLFFIGIELSLRSFRRMWRLALFATLIQIGASLLIMLPLMRFLGWTPAQAVLCAFVLAMSSTAVAIAMLNDIDELRTRTGRIAVGVLIAQDLAVAPMLLIVGGMAGDGIGIALVVKVAVSIGLLVLVIRYFTRRQKISLPLAAMVHRKEVMAIAALGWCFGFAAVAGLLGLSPAFGAFLAGLLVGNSAERQSVYETAEPIQAVLLMVFFLSIGLLIDLRFLLDNLVLVLGLWLFTAVFKTAMNTVALRILGERWQGAFLSSLVLAQLGEFSFVLGGVALSLAIIDAEIYRLIVAVTVLSLITGPLWLDAARRLNRAMETMDSVNGLLGRVYGRRRPPPQADA